ncbi:hypothetical protein K469DRAFT_797608 [Zopfia rhizophila CBS 207.26]|uniref:Uncharacterized protein n=1 Tax=Zopfia rhizophila CBS 207.26 TaxID=1314779 RepID=A0A6A6DLC6_9PEZI|nr:hypothetical protein K469DRAFT_797608 [Zopfia rhizophila CBS 207.26]
MIPRLSMNPPSSTATATQITFSLPDQATMFLICAVLLLLWFQYQAFNSLRRDIEEFLERPRSSSHKAKNVSRNKAKQDNDPNNTVISGLISEINLLRIALGHLTNCIGTEHDRLPYSSPRAQYSPPLPYRQRPSRSNFQRFQRASASIDNDEPRLNSWTIGEGGPSDDVGWTRVDYSSRRTPNRPSQQAPRPTEPYPRPFSPGTSPIRRPITNDELDGNIEAGPSAGFSRKDSRHDAMFPGHHTHVLPGHRSNRVPISPPMSPRRVDQGTRRQAMAGMGMERLGAGYGQAEQLLQSPMQSDGNVFFGPQPAGNEDGYEYCDPGQLPDGRFQSPPNSFGG